MHAFDLPGSDAIGDTYGLQDHQIKQQSQLQPHPFRQASQRLEKTGTNVSVNSKSVKGW